MRVSYGIGSRFCRAWACILCSLICLGASTAVWSSERAFQAFEQLAAKDFGKDKGVIGFLYDDCKLLAATLDTPGKTVARLSYLGPPGLGGLRLVRFDNYPVQFRDQFFYTRLGFTFTYLDLRDVERISNFVGRHDVEVIMERGKTIARTRATVSFDFSSVSFGQSKTRDEARFDALLHVSEMNDVLRFRLPKVLENPENWAELTASEAGFREVFFESGTFTPAFQDIKLSFSDDRSRKLGIAKGWPEDAAKIHQAFASLVEACG